MKLLQVTTIVSPGIITFIICVHDVRLSTLRMYALIYIGLTRGRGVALFNLAMIDYTRIRKDLEKRKFAVLPNSVYHPRLEVSFKSQYQII